MGANRSSCVTHCCKNPATPIDLVRLPPLMLDWLGPDYIIKEQFLLRGDDVPFLPLFTRACHRRPSHTTVAPLAASVVQGYYAAMSQSGQISLPARQLALNILNEFDSTHRRATDLLHEDLNLTAEKAFATDLVCGVVRNSTALDLAIEHACGRPISRVAAKMLNILRLGAYELIYTPDTPDYAVVNEAVELARRTAGPKQTAFVNAVLRNLTRTILQRSAPLAAADPRCTLPTSPVMGCLMSAAILPDPADNPAKYLATAFSLPHWLVQEWVLSLGFGQSMSVCHASNRRPKLYLQPNTLRTTAAGLAELLGGRDVACTLTPDARMVRLDCHVPAALLPGFSQGLFTIQDPAAAEATAALAPRCGEVILDMCSAPGTKTVRIAQLMDDKGLIVATDADSVRLAKVTENCTRLGIASVKAVAMPDLAAALRDLPALDGVLLDVPCSNTGVLARRCDLRRRLSRRSVSSLARTQLTLLQTAASLSPRPRRVLYSTCSVLRAENQDVVQGFLEGSPGWRLDFERLALPAVDPQTGFDHDGGYIALLRPN